MFFDVIIIDGEALNDEESILHIDDTGDAAVFIELFSLILYLSDNSADGVVIAVVGRESHCLILAVLLYERDEILSGERLIPDGLGKSELFPAVVIAVAGYHHIADAAEIDGDILSDSVVAGFDYAVCLGGHVVVQLLPQGGNALNVVERILGHI